MMRTLYMAIEPHATGFLQVSQDHEIYWEESGNPKGQPIVFLHGGPGLGTKAHNRCFFDPNHYRIILVDQRAAGKSRFVDPLKENTTWDLIEDLEKLRLHLQINSWILFGGSWGSTLALAYAICHPKQVRALLIRGIFLCRSADIHWFHGDGASHIFPDIWESFVELIPVEERKDLIQAFYCRLTSSDESLKKKALQAWSMWGAKTYRHLPEEMKSGNLTFEGVLTSSQIECHYLKNRGFFPSDNWILDNIHQIRHLPCKIIHGRYDMVCSMQNAWDLHMAWPESDLEIIPDGGHSSSEASTLDALIRATDAFTNLK